VQATIYLFTIKILPFQSLNFVMKYTFRFVIAICTAALACSAARAEVVYAVQPTLSAAPGDIGQSFDVILTNTGPSDISISGFVFEVTVSDPDITLTGADFSTGARPYIFAGDSFDEDNSFPLSFTGIDTTAQTLQAGDLTNDISNVTLTSGESLALGDVLFDVADDATPGQFTVLFTGSTGVTLLNNLSDDAGNAIPVDTFSGATGTIASPTPEPGTALLSGGALGVLGLLRRRR
jgi:hypothetical protein